MLGSLFCQPQNKNKIQKQIHHQSGKALYNPQEIVNTFSEYNEQLYNLKENIATFQPTSKYIEYFLNKVNLPKIYPITLGKLNQPIPIEETLKGIKSLPAHKATGIDGLSIVNTIKTSIKY